MVRRARAQGELPWWLEFLPKNLADLLLEEKQHPPLSASTWKEHVFKKLLKHTLLAIIHTNYKSQVLTLQDECSQGHVSWLSVCMLGKFSVYFLVLTGRTQAVLNKLKASKEMLPGDASHITFPWPCFFSWQPFILSFHSILIEHLLYVKHCSRYWGKMWIWPVLNLSHHRYYGS